MDAGSEGAEVVLKSNGYRNETDLEREQRLKRGYCCWHCQYYVRPGELMLDGPVHSICTIDRADNVYEVYGDIGPGDKEHSPNDSCDRFEMDIPPVQVS